MAQASERARGPPTWSERTDARTDQDTARRRTRGGARPDPAHARDSASTHSTPKRQTSKMHPHPPVGLGLSPEPRPRPRLRRIFGEAAGEGRRRSVRLAVVLVHPHVLPQIIVPAEILPTARHRTLVRCNRNPRRQRTLCTILARQRTHVSRSYGCSSRAASGAPRAQSTCRTRAPRTRTPACSFPPRPAPP